MPIKSFGTFKRNSDLEAWLRTEGVARYDAYHRAPKGHYAAKVFARLRRHHVRRAKKNVVMPAKAGIQ